ncbi:MAG: terpene cyclase/mutase family protein [Planctomycetes bacterium]|nr:terpene cyclase/mutase family protein [Planctomycetota bacterium]
MILLFPAVAVLLLATQHGCEAPRREEKEPVVRAVDEPADDGPADDGPVDDKKQPQNPVGPLAAGVKFLLAAQDDDGAWRSKTYGQLKGGAATTALVLYALSHLNTPRGENVDAAAGRAVGFLQPGIEKYGYVCDPDGTPAYPTYGGAMLLIAVDRIRLPLPRALREKLIDDLIRDQLTERQNWQPDSIHYGGWDVVRAEHATPPITSGTNISVSAMALEALHGCQHNEKPAALTRARQWAQRCQNFPQDGGFFFSPDANRTANKAGTSDAETPQPRSYGTATCDGLRAIVYCGAAAEDPRFKAAVAWLVRHKRVDEVPGFKPSKASSRWSAGLVYYHCAMLSKVLVHLPPEERNSRGKRIRDFLAKGQQEDGHWASDVARMREDDPLIATAFAVIALAETK